MGYPTCPRCHKHQQTRMIDSSLTMDDGYLSVAPIWTCDGCGFTFDKTQLGTKQRAMFKANKVKIAGTNYLEQQDKDDDLKKRVENFKLK